MYGGNSGIDQTWSLFGDFGEPYLPDSVSGSSVVVTLPVSGISIPHVQNQGHLVHDGFGIAGSPESGYHKDTSSDVMAALSFQRFLPSNNEAFDDDGGVLDAYTCDEFRMYDFKVRRCVRGRSHDWTECPYAHPGEKARRRDPRKFHYSGTACPDFRKGSCKRGDACEFAHGVFECWLHPARYRTQPCKDGTACRRRVCFFAHTPEQLRLLSPSQSAGQLSPRHLVPGHSLGESYDGSPLRKALASGLDLDAYLSGKPSLMFSPTSTLTGHGAVSPPAISPPTSPTSDSPPLSPANLSANPNANRHSCAFSPRRTTNAMSDMLASLRNLQIGKAKNSSSPWATASSGLFSQSPRAPSCLRSSFSSLPSTPTGFTPSHDIWGFGSSSGRGTGLVFDTDFPEELPTERVESGRDVRASMFAKLRSQNSLDRPETPEVGWVSELVT